jgi:hypothetical protein
VIPTSLCRTACRRPTPASALRRPLVLKLAAAVRARRWQDDAIDLLPVQTDQIGVCDDNMANCRKQRENSARWSSVSGKAAGSRYAASPADTRAEYTRPDASQAGFCRQFMRQSLLNFRRYRRPSDPTRRDRVT